MELLVLGIGIMALGAAILHLAIEGRKVAAVPVAATRTQPRPHFLSRNEPARATRPRIAAVVIDPEADEPNDEAFEQPALAPINGEAFGKTDILLAEALTELLDLKEQVSSLRARVDALTAEAAAKPAAEPRHAPKHLRRRVHGFAS
jgi:hypothetical protein